MILRFTGPAWDIRSAHSSPRFATDETVSMSPNPPATALGRPDGWHSFALALRAYRTAARTRHTGAYGIRSDLRKLYSGSIKTQTVMYAGLVFWFYKEKGVTNETSWEGKEEECYDVPDRNTP